MIFVTSDIHGRWEKYRALLEKISTADQNNTIYLLGDFIDRGDDGCKILLDAMQRPNIIPILGNHELTAAICLPWILQEVTDQNLSALREEQFAALQEWILNGGTPTLRELKKLSMSKRKAILEYIREMDVYIEVEAGGRSFLLTHAGLNHFVPDKPFDEYKLTDYLFGRSILEQEFYSDKYLVYGHTPTQILHKQLGEAPANDIIFYKSQIAIDCGCGFGGPLGCLCVDTMESFYF